jgi:hypothetical protein
MISGQIESQMILSLASMGKAEQQSVTWWDFKLRRETNRLADLNYAIRGRIVQEPFKMEDENRRECLDVHLLARHVAPRWTELHGLQVRDACECVFYNVHRIVLLDSLDVSH